MEFFRIKKDIPFMRHALKFNIISLVTFLLAVVFLFSIGLHLSVEFTGGTLIEVAYKQAADLEKIRGSLGKSGFNDYVVQNFGSSRRAAPRSRPSATPRCRCAARWAPDGTSPTRPCSWLRTRPVLSQA